MTEAGLVLDDLVVARWGRTLLAATSLAAPPGASLAILGGTGSGRSSILATIAGRLRPRSGSVRLDGRAPRPELTGYAEQQHDLPDGLTAAEHLAVPLLARGRAPEGWGGVDAQLTALGLPEAAHHNLLEELSGGQQQRVAVARALIGDPPLVCLDDPVSELDAASAEVVWTALAGVERRGGVLVVSTTSAADAERCSSVLRLD